MNIVKNKGLHARCLNRSRKEKVISFDSSSKCEKLTNYTTSTRDDLSERDKLFLKNEFPDLFKVGDKK